MEIVGLGTDIIEVERIRAALHRHGVRFVEHLFTEKEAKHAAKHHDPAPHIAGRFAAKEAVLKAIGTGLTKAISWHDIEILSDSQGKPEVYFSDRLIELFPDATIYLSISHAKEYATATAIYTQLED